MNEDTSDAVDYAALKRAGFLPQVQKDRFSLRLRVAGGQLSAAQLKKAGELAERYGRGFVHLTSRQSVEIPFIALADIDAVRLFLAKSPLRNSASGPCVRTITACQGAAVCSGGMIETTELAAELDARYLGRGLPHKFKIGITGCKNNCLKAEQDDLGIKGAMLPEWREQGEKKACTYCGLCAKGCPANALSVDKEKRTLSFARGDCRYCGKCVKACPVHAWTGKKGYRLFFGGTFGNAICPGVPLLPVLFDKETVLKATDAAISFFAAHAQAGERLSKVMQRVGADSLKKALEAAVL